MNVSGFNFEYLKETRFNTVYNELNLAKGLDEIDKRSCCTKLRYTLEIIISEIIDIIGWNNCKGKNLYDNIMLLSKNLPYCLKEYNGEDIVKEMHNVRKYGNDGTHYATRNNVDLNKAAKTCWIAINKICHWANGFESNYYIYMEEERKRQKRKEEEKRKRNEKRKRTAIKWLKRLGRVILPGLDVLLELSLELSKERKK